jgi:hypothetical protein
MRHVRQYRGILALGTRCRLESISYDGSFIPGTQAPGILLDALIVFGSWSESGAEENVFCFRRKLILAELSRLQKME